MTATHAALAIIALAALVSGHTALTRLDEAQRQIERLYAQVEHLRDQFHHGAGQ